MACGDGDKASDEVAAPVLRQSCPDQGKGMKLSVKLTTAAPPRTGSNVTWQLILRNDGSDSGTIVVPTSQLGDVSLMQSGEEIYRWSRERTFAQAMQCFELRAGHAARLELGDDILEINQGQYEATATVASQQSPATYRGPFTVLPR